MSDIQEVIDRLNTKFNARGANKICAEFYEGAHIFGKHMILAKIYDPESCSEISEEAAEATLKAARKAQPEFNIEREEWAAAYAV